MRGISEKRFTLLCLFISAIMVDFTSATLSNSTVEQKCQLNLRHDSITKRIFEGQKIEGIQAIIQVFSRSIFVCDAQCKNILSCYGYTYAAGNGTCWIYNTTNLKYHLVEMQGVETVLKLPIYCKESTTGIWSPWSMIESEKSSIGWYSSFGNRTCLESEIGCKDALCEGATDYKSCCQNCTCEDGPDTLTFSETGIYNVTILGNDVNLYVEVDANVTAWIHIQRREDGSIDFYRDWNTYKTGFGDVSSEFWLGNDIIHELTKMGNAMIRFELFDGQEWRYAEYDHFQIDDESQQYCLNATGYSGNAGDSLSYHSGSKFTTKDSDNDNSHHNCAKRYYGAWWYNSCYYSNLNGSMFPAGSTHLKGVNWRRWKGFQSLMKTKKKIRYRSEK